MHFLLITHRHDRNRTLHILVHTSEYPPALSGWELRRKISALVFWIGGKPWWELWRGFIFELPPPVTKKKTRLSSANNEKPWIESFLSFPSFLPLSNSLPSWTAPRLSGSDYVTTCFIGKLCTTRIIMCGTGITCWAEELVVEARERGCFIRKGQSNQSKFTVGETKINSPFVCVWD